MAQKYITHYFKSPSKDKQIEPARNKNEEVSKKRKREEIVPKFEVEDKILEPVKKENENELDVSLQKKKSKIEDDVESKKLNDAEETEAELNESLQQKSKGNDSAENEHLGLSEKKCKPLIEDGNILLDGAEYNPSKRDYDPINDAFWKKGNATPYLALSRSFQLIEEIKGRLKSIEILSNFFRSVIILSPQDLLACMYLSVNQLAPAHEGLELGIAETSLMRAICSATGQSLTHLKSKVDAVGDLGIVAEQARSSQRVMFRPAPLTVKGVFEALKYVANLSGHSAMNKKLEKIKGIFVACRHSEARYIIRSLLGKLRIGIAEQSALLALSNAISSTQSKSSTNATLLKKAADEHFMILKTTYCQCPIYDRIIPLLLKHDITELPKLCPMEPGIPIKPMLAQPMNGVHEVLSRFEGLRFTCEWKYDGERAQIHCDEKGTISIYSRNQENNTTKYPDIITRIPQIPKEGVTSFIIDSEVVAWDIENNQILPFQKLITRKRKNVDSSDIQVQVCVYMFDLLYLNGEALVSKSFIERRQLLRDNFQEVGQWKFATSLDTSDIDELQQFLEQSIKGNCEGLMVKTLEKEADYEIARRSRNWLKLKKDYLSGTGDSLDLVVIGAYTGKGKRAGVYGGFLLACYDSTNEEYQSICKIGTGFSDEDLKDHFASLKDYIIKSPKSYCQYDSSLEADIWFEPVKVWEVKCADLSLSPVHKAGVGIIDQDKGISLRFPRFLRIRDDKSAEDATSAQQVVDMYLAQSQIVNQSSSARNDLDDFY